MYFFNLLLKFFNVSKYIKKNCIYILFIKKISGPSSLNKEGLYSGPTNKALVYGISDFDF